MPIPTELKASFDTFWAANHKRFDMAHKEECGKYMEEAIPYVQNDTTIPVEIRRNVGFLAKFGSQTQYNGHSIDTFAYDFGGNLTHSCDVIGNAEQPHPWNSEGGTNRPDPVNAFSEDTATAYQTDKHWLSEPGEEPTPVPNNSVPYTSYQGDTSNAELKRALAYDYTRRPQGADWDISVWAFRVQHSALMGPVAPQDGGHPLGITAAVDKHRPEWCAALGVPVVPIPPDWNIGDPV